MLGAKNAGQISSAWCLVGKSRLNRRCLVLSAKNAGQIAGAWCLVGKSRLNRRWKRRVLGRKCRCLVLGLTGIARHLDEQSSDFNACRQIKFQQSLRYAPNFSQTNNSSFREFEMISPTLRARVEQWCQRSRCRISGGNVGTLVPITVKTGPCQIVVDC